MHDPSKNVLLTNIDAEVLLERYGGRSTYDFDVDTYAAAVADLDRGELPCKVAGTPLSHRGSMEIAAAATAADFMA